MAYACLVQPFTDGVFLSLNVRTCPKLRVARSSSTLLFSRRKVSHDITATFTERSAVNLTSAIPYHAPRVAHVPQPLPTQHTTPIMRRESASFGRHHHLLPASICCTSLLKPSAMMRRCSRGRFVYTSRARNSLMIVAAPKDFSSSSDG